MPFITNAVAITLPRFLLGSSGDGGRLHRSFALILVMFRVEQ